MIIQAVGVDASANFKTDWVCLELVGSRRVYAKLSFDPWGPERPSGFFEVTSEVYELMRVMASNGQPKMALISMREQPGEVLDPPYLFNTDNIVSFARLATGSPLYEAIRERESGLIQPRPSLVVPGQ